MVYKYNIILLCIFIMISCFNKDSKNNSKKLSIITRIACHEDELIKKLERSQYKCLSSSTLPSSGKFNYEPENLFDNNKNTCWCPEGDGIGEYVIFKIPFGIRGIRITNGLATNKKLFNYNNRVKKIYLGLISKKYYPQKEMAECDLCGKSEFTSGSLTLGNKFITLNDSYLVQDEILFSDIEGKENDDIWSFEGNKRSKNNLYLIIGITDIYKGDKYNDTCISEINIIR